MLSTYTVKYTAISSGYMGQPVEWPEVITEGETLEECRAMLEDALREMVAAYQQQNREIPSCRALLEYRAVGRKWGNNPPCLEECNVSSPLLRGNQRGIKGEFKKY